MTTVCRTEIADCLENAFNSAPLTPDALVEFAESNGARPQVIGVLGRLHEDAYRNIRELWRELADVPLEQ